MFDLHSNPVSRNGTSADNDQITDCGIVEHLIDVGTARVSNRLKDDCVVQTKTIESNIKKEPRAGSAEKDLSVLPLAVVSPKVAP